jgi:RHS repeat-associated protein
MPISPGTPLGGEPTLFPDLLQVAWGEGELENLLGDDHPCQVTEVERAECWPSPNPDFFIDPLNPSFPLEEWARALMGVFGWTNFRKAMCTVFWCLRNLSSWPFTPKPEDKSLWEQYEEAAQAILDWITSPPPDRWCAPVVELPGCEHPARGCGPGRRATDNGLEINLQGNAQLRVPLPAVAGALGDKVELTYNSANAGLVSEFGQGWKSNLSRKVSDLGGGSVKLTRGDGTELTYTGNPAVGNLYTAPDGATTSLKRLSSGWEELLRSGGKRTYDSGGNLTSASSARGTWTVSYSGGVINKLTDPTGGVTTFTYTSGKLSNIKDRAGRETQFTVNAQGDLVTYTTPELCTTSIIYDNSHRPIGWVTPAGVPSSYTYDASNRITGIIGADNTSTAFADRPRTTITYGTNQLAIQDARGFRTTYALDASSRLTAQIRPDGTRTTYSWQNNWPRTIQGGAGLVYTYTYQTLSTDPSLRVLQSIQNPTGNRVTYQLDASARLQAIVQPDGARGTLSWDGNQIQSYQDPMDRRVTYSYTASRKQLDKVELPGGSRYTLSYDSKGQLQTFQDGTGACSTMTYDTAGFPKTVQNPLGPCTTYQRDDVNRLISKENMYGNRLSFTYEMGTRQLKTVMNPAGGCTTLLYNNAGRLKEALSASGSCTTILYDKIGNWTEQVSGTGERTTYAYDGLNRRQAAVTPYGGRSTTVFDNGGRVLATVSPTGSRSTNVYDSQNGRLLAMVDPFGRRTSYSYDTIGRRIGVQDALGNRSTTAYDTVDRPIAFIDALNRRTTTVYDIRGRVQATVNPLGERTTFGYDNANRRISAMNPLGYVSSTVYDASGNSIANVDPLGNRTSYAYDMSGRQIAVMNPLGFRSTTVFDSAGRVQAMVDPLGNRTTNTYDAASRLTEVKNALGNVSSQIYDGANRVIATVDPLGNRATTTYNLSARFVLTSDPLNRKTTQMYDTSGRLITIENALGFRTTTTYDAKSRPRNIQSARGFMTTSSYDATGRLEATVDALGNRSTFGYDVVGQRINVKDAMERVVTSVYDGAGRIQATVNMLGQRNTTVYDAAGQTIASVNPLGQRNTLVYDKTGRVQAIVNALNWRTSFSYDAASRLIETKDARGNVTTNVYDAESRMIAVVDTLGSRTTTQYDGIGQVAKFTNARNYSSTITYDAASRKRTEMDPLGRITTLTYTAASELWEVLDARGIRVTNTYDLAGRLTKMQYTNDATVTMTYDAVGNQIQIKDAAGTWDFSYDGRNLMTSMSDPATNRLTYTYNGAWQRKVLQTPAGTFTYSYDSVGRISNHLNPEGYRATYTYDAAGREIKKELGNGTLASTVYDAAGNVTMLANKKSDGTIITSHAYQYDAVGNRTQVTENTGATVSWGYDKANRLTSEIRTGTNAFSTTYTYDAIGNRLTQKKQNGALTTYTYDAADQLNTSQDSTGTSNYSYDLAGNQTVMVTPSGQRTTSTWSNRNQRIKIQRPDNTIVTMIYRFDSLRYKREEGAATKKFVYDGQNYLLETDATNGIALATTSKPETYGNLVSQRVKLAPTTWATVFHHFDALGSTMALTDTAATVANSYHYNAWGELISQTEGIFNSFKWVGKLGYYFENEETLDKYYIRARYYDIETGRWMSQDPLFFPTRGHAIHEPSSYFLYTNSNPLKEVDPSGLQCATVPRDDCLHVARRGTIQGAMINSGYSFLAGSATELRFSANAAAFKRGDCCCCDKIGFVNVLLRWEVKYGRYRFIHQNRPIVDDFFRLFPGIPYPFSTTANPCLQPGQIEMEDNPGAAWTGWLGLWGPLTRVVHRFETCVICLEGVEGYRQAPPGVVSYGCVRWGHVISRTASGSYSYMRYMGDEPPSFGDENIRVAMISRAGEGPSDEYCKAILTRIRTLNLFQGIGKYEGEWQQ